MDFRWGFSREQDVGKVSRRIQRFLVRGGDLRYSLLFFVRLARFFGRSQVGLRLGIVGMGSIGRVRPIFPPLPPLSFFPLSSSSPHLPLLFLSFAQIVARYLTALGMKVSYYNRNKLSQDLEAGATYVSSLDEVSAEERDEKRGETRQTDFGFHLRSQLLRNTDVLSVHVPLSSATKGLIGARELSLMPKGGVVINTSRGPRESSFRSLSFPFPPFPSSQTPKTQPN